MSYDKVNQAQVLLHGPHLRAARSEMRRRRFTALRAEGKGRVRAALAAWKETRQFRGPRFAATGRTEVFVHVGTANIHVGLHNEHGCTEYTYPLYTVARLRTNAKD